jgi:hypothetical protein
MLVKTRSWSRFRERRAEAALSPPGLRRLLADARGLGRCLGEGHGAQLDDHALRLPPGLKGDLPYILLTVDLPEGVRMNAQARGIAAADLRLGMPVRVGFETVKDGLTLPVFEAA